MAITFEETGRPAAKEDVAAFEATLPGPLPPDYRTFLLRQNGGWAPDCWWPPERGPANFATSEFYSVGPVAEKSRSITWVRSLFTGRIPDDFVAVGSDANGNQLCLALTDADEGSVWFFDHELETDGGEEPSRELLTQVCGSFDELLAVAELMPELEEMRRRADAAHNCWRDTGSRGPDGQVSAVESEPTS